MKVTADTNVLVRYVVKDDVAQWKAASEVLENAALVAISLPVLCELVWVLRGAYRLPAARISEVIAAFLLTGNVELNRSATEAGLQALHAGGDFADGVVAYEGAYLGGEVFVSFDRKAVNLLKRHGYETELLSARTEE